MVDIDSSKDALARNVLAEAAHLIAIQRLLPAGRRHEAERLSQLDEMARPGIGNGNLATRAEGPRHFAEILGSEHAYRQIHGTVADRPFGPDIGNDETESLVMPSRDLRGLLGEIDAQATARSADPRRKTADDAVQVIAGAATGLDNERLNGQPFVPRPGEDCVGYEVEGARRQKGVATLQLQTRVAARCGLSARLPAPG